MPEYQRSFQAGGTYFLTVVTANRSKILCLPSSREYLREAIKSCQRQWPFDDLAWVLLEDHLHTIWSLPKGDMDYSKRWGYIKKEFTKSYIAGGGLEQSTSMSRKNKRERGVWQRRFWEHTIRDEDDFQKHLDYIHYNPVKHGLVDVVKDWEYSTFHRYVEKGVYEVGWGSGEEFDFSGIVDSVGE